MKPQYIYYENKLMQMLKAADIRMTACYRPEQVLKILNISQMTFRSLCDKWVPESAEVYTNKVGGLESYIIGKQRRVPHHGLVEWLIVNNSFNKQRSL